MRRRCRSWFLAFALNSAIAVVPFQAQDQQPQSGNPGDYRIKVTSDLVLTNVVVRDKQGNLVRGLTKDDFTLVEDGKPQRISSFDFENVDALVTAGDAGPTVAGTASPIKVIGTQEPFNKEGLKNHRLIVLFFDFGGMEPHDIDRAVSAAQKYLDKQMAPADLVAIVSLASSMRVDQDFTNTKPRLNAVLRSYSSGEGEGFQGGDTGSAGELAFGWPVRRSVGRLPWLFFVAGERHHPEQDAAKPPRDEHHHGSSHEQRLSARRWGRFNVRSSWRWPKK